MPTLLCAVATVPQRSPLLCWVCFHVLGCLTAARCPTWAVAAQAAAAPGGCILFARPRSSPASPAVACWYATTMCVAQGHVVQHVGRGAGCEDLLVDLRERVFGGGRLGLRIKITKATRRGDPRKLHKASEHIHSSTTHPVRGHVTHARTTCVGMCVAVRVGDGQP